MLDLEHLVGVEVWLPLDTSGPLLLAGDFNVRPRASGLYERLGERFGLTGPTGPAAIDHMLSRGLEISSPPQAWPEVDRELIVRRGR